MRKRMRYSMRFLLLIHNQNPGLITVFKKPAEHFLPVSGQGW